MKITTKQSVKTLTALYIVVFVAVGYQKYLLGGYNNYLMFTMPFGWMLEGKSLYDWQVFLFKDLYKYSPTFALLMAPFYYLNNIGLGVLLWNLLGTLVLLGGIKAFFSPLGEVAHRNALLIVFLEALITAQNHQSNNMIVGLMLWGMSHLRNEKVFWAAFMFSICGFIKFYGIAVAIFFLFYPKKIQFLASMVFWCIVFALLPLLMMSPEVLLSEYKRWFVVMGESKLKQQVSVMGILESWFGLPVNYTVIEAIGALLFLVPFVQFKKWKDVNFQQGMVAYLFMFIIIFNKMAESPTYVYAVVGVAVWFTWLKQPTRTDYILLALVVVFTSLSQSDLFPASIRTVFFVPYNIKAVPILLLWGRMQWLIYFKTQHL